MMQDFQHRGTNLGMNPLHQVQPMTRQPSGGRGIAQPSQSATTTGLRSGLTMNTRQATTAPARPLHMNGPLMSGPVQLGSNYLPSQGQGHMIGNVHPGVNYAPGADVVSMLKQQGQAGPYAQTLMNEGPRPFDMSEFPALGGDSAHPAPSPNPEFAMQHEDFPALSPAHASGPSGQGQVGQGRGAPGSGNPNHPLGLTPGASPSPGPSSQLQGQAGSLQGGSQSQNNSAHMDGLGVLGGMSGGQNSSTAPRQQQQQHAHGLGVGLGGMDQLDAETGLDAMSAQLQQMSMAAGRPFLGQGIGRGRQGSGSRPDGQPGPGLIPAQLLAQQSGGSNAGAAVPQRQASGGQGGQIQVGPPGSGALGQNAGVQGSPVKPAGRGSGTAPNSNNNSNSGAPGSSTGPTPKSEKYGLRGLLSVIRMTEPDLNTLALGTDLTTLGLNLNSTEVLYATFAYPCHDAPIKRDPDYVLPYCYYMQPPALKTSHLTKFKPETLFYIFYNMPKDTLQVYAAKELYNRGWRYNKELKLWFTREDPGKSGTTVTTSQPPPYIYFDINTWEKKPFRDTAMLAQGLKFMTEEEHASLGP